MSNKTQLQENNTKYASLIETLRGKALPSGEDVGEETTAYTNKLSELGAAITALETELAGKASGDSSGGSVETCTVTITLGGTNGAYGGVGYTSVQNNEIIACNKLLVPNNTVEITCLCGSVLVVDETSSRLLHTYDNLAEIANEQDATYLGEMNIVKVFQVLAPANGTASLIIETHGE